MDNQTEVSRYQTQRDLSSVKNVIWNFLANLLMYLEEKLFLYD